MAILLHLGVLEHKIRHSFILSFETENSLFICESWVVELICVERDHYDNDAILIVFLINFGEMGSIYVSMNVS